jgi:hypothetical protein
MWVRVCNEKGTLTRNASVPKVKMQNQKGVGGPVSMLQRISRAPSAQLPYSEDRLLVARCMMAWVKLWRVKEIAWYETVRRDDHYVCLTRKGKATWTNVQKAASANGVLLIKLDEDWYETPKWGRSI